MENNKRKYRKGAVLSGILSLIMTTSCADFKGDVTVTIREKKEEDIEPIIEVEEEATWVQFDENKLMYKVDLDKFLKDKLKLSKELLENSDFINLMEIVHEKLGEDFYTYDKSSNTLYNVDGKIVSISSSLERQIWVRFYNGDILSDDYIDYEIDVSQNGNTFHISRSIEEDFDKFSKYYMYYNEDKNTERSRAICFRENGEKFLDIDLHNSIYIFDTYSLTFDTEMGSAEVKLSDKDYEMLHEIMVSYSDSDNLYEFLSDNIDLLNRYLVLIRDENVEFYEDLCSLMTEFIEKGKILRYE